MGGVTGIRFVVDPLVPFVERAYKPPSDKVSHVGLTAKLSQVFDLSKGTADRWRRTGLTLDEADRYADVAGEHPSVLWPEWEQVDWSDDDDLSDLCGLGNWSGVKRHKTSGSKLCGACAAFKKAYEQSWRERNPDYRRDRYANRTAEQIEAARAQTARYMKSLATDPVKREQRRQAVARNTAAYKRRRKLAQDGTVSA